MAVKLADTLAPMGNFEIAEAKDISVMIGDTKKMLQQAIEDGDIGGAGEIVVKCTEAQYGALLPAQKALNIIYCTEKFLYYHDESLAPVVDADAIMDAIGDLEELKTEEKGSVVGAINEVSDSLVDLENDVAHRVALEYNSITDADNAPDGFSNGYNSTHAPSQGIWYKYVTFSIDGSNDYRVQEAHSLSTNKIYVRRKEGGEGWGSWHELATMDKVGVKTMQITRLADASGNVILFTESTGVPINIMFNDAQNPIVTWYFGQYEKTWYVVIPKMADQTAKFTLYYI